uniref:Envelope protein n=1 Tax=Gouania willdenowi TaxID=441366 RepID=A0A8C5GPY9_GOUWI
MHQNVHVQHSHGTNAVAGTLNRSKRSALTPDKIPGIAAHSYNPSRPCLLFPAGKTTTVKIDLCAIITCYGDEASWRGMTVYLCTIPDGRSTPGAHGAYTWPECVWSTDPTWGKDPTYTFGGLERRMSIFRDTSLKSCEPGDCNPLYISVINARFQDQLKTVDSDFNDLTSTIPTVAELVKNLIPNNTYLGKEMSYSDVLSVEKGFNERNLWLQWLRYTARTVVKADCIVCAGARPSLATSPFDFDLTTINCVLLLFKRTVPMPKPCFDLTYKYPAVSAPVGAPPTATAYPANYTCFLREAVPGSVSVGLLPPVWCARNITVGPVMNDSLFEAFFLGQDEPRSDLWWLCGDMRLRPILPANWHGICTLTLLIAPFKIIPYITKDEVVAAVGPPPRRPRRAAPLGSFDKNIYIDAIGVPRGVPDEFKARCQIGAGFESIFLFPTINKNVDWLNFIFYNQQRFINYTRDAIQGIHEQLAPTSLMAWQNRLGLDMLLAERGGVCTMFGDDCCVFIPNNTAPDGSVTRALSNLKALSEEVAATSGVSNPISTWFGSLYDNWYSFGYSLLISAGVTLLVLAVVGLVIIPIVRGLIVRLTTRLVSGTMLSQNLPEIGENTPFAPNGPINKQPAAINAYEFI